MKTDVLVVSHTHWDREWYATQSTFLMMNVDMMNRVLSILKECPKFRAFLLDGQTIALEDYLVVCPERRGEVEDYIRSGRLAVGPWYVLPDEFLASGEAHIRNFMTGVRLVPEGMRIGYLPDSFGHPSQMPQILSGLGLGEIVFWRGTGPEMDKAEFWWAGRDGSKILALNMPFGYSNAACLPEDPARRQARLEHEIGKLAPLSALGLVLMMNGSDHIAPDRRVAEWIDEFQQVHPEWSVRMATMQEYVRQAHARAESAALQTVSGELRSGYRAYLLGDTLSTRMPLKQRQRAVEAKLEGQLEPMLTLLDMSGRLEYPMDKMRWLWKLALQNLPHDSICGCSVDAVHREMEGRYDRVDEICETLFLQAASAMDGDASEAADGTVTVWNTRGGRRCGRVEVELKKTIGPLRYVDYAQDQRLLEFEPGDAPLPKGVVFTDASGREQIGRILSARLGDTVERRMDEQPLMNRCLIVRAAFTAEAEGIGFARYSYRLTDAEPERAERCELENEEMLVRGDGRGALDVYCKRTGRWLRGQNALADVADAGDEYTFDALNGDVPVRMDPDSVRESAADGVLRITGRMVLPAALEPNRRARSRETAACGVTVEAWLAGERLEIRTTIDNAALDHRLIACFPLGGRASRCLSDSTFSLEQRALVWSDAGYEDWMEKPNNQFFQKNFSDLAGGGEALSVFVRGLPQFEVGRDGERDELRLTLLRCVGWLSRKDLQSRNGNGGWTIETPGAQEQGRRSFEYALYPHRPEESDVSLFERAMTYNQGLFALQTCARGATALTAERWIRIDDPRVCVSALKAAESGEGWILRLVNLSAQPVTTRLGFDGDVRRVTLDERPMQELGGADLTFGPWQILTLHLRRGGNA